MTHQRLLTRIWHSDDGTRDGVETVRVRLLGGFTMSVGPRTVEESGWRIKKAAGLVKLLALARGHKLHREQVMDALWPDLDKGSQTNNFHRALHCARETLGSATTSVASPYLPLRAPLLELCPDSPLWVDAGAFKGSAVAARRNRDPAVMTRLAAEKRRRPK